MTTEKRWHPFDKLLKIMDPSSPDPAARRVRAALTEVAGEVRRARCDGRRPNRVVFLHAAGEVLAALAEHADAVPPVLPLSAHGTATMTGSLQVALAPLTAQVKGVTLGDNGHGVDTLTSAATGLSHEGKRRLVQVHVFMVVFVVLCGVVARFEQLAQDLGPYLGGSALGIAWCCSAQAGRAYDKMFAPDHRED